MWEVWVCSRFYVTNCFLWKQECKAVCDVKLWNRPVPLTSGLLVQITASSAKFMWLARHRKSEILGNSGVICLLWMGRFILGTKNNFRDFRCTLRRCPDNFCSECCHRRRPTLLRSASLLYVPSHLLIYKHIKTIVGVHVKKVEKWHCPYILKIYITAFKWPITVSRSV